MAALRTISVARRHHHQARYQHGVMAAPSHISRRHERQQRVSAGG